MEEKGFTVIELLVVITIIAVFITIVISYFSQIKFQFALSRVSYTFNQDLRKAQNMALSSVLYKDSSGTEQMVDGYGVYVNIDILENKKYIIYADKYPGDQQYDSLDYIIDVIDFSSSEPGIIIKEMNNIIGNETSVNFNFSNFNTQIAHLDSGQNSVDFIFALESNLTNTKTVLVNTSGLIEVK